MTVRRTGVVAVAEALLAAENAHDVEAAVSLFADGAVVRASMETLRTPPEVRRWQEFLAASNLSIKPGEFWEDRDRVRWDGWIAADFFRRLGLAELTGRWEIVVSGGKIVEFTFELSDESLALVQRKAQLNALE